MAQAKNLQQLIESQPSSVHMLRNAQPGPNVYPGVPPEFTNWRDEQAAWQQTCVLFDLSYHMVDLTLKGPDALKLLTQLGPNSFEGFRVNQAKQFAPCSHEGYIIGDVILLYLGKETFSLVGRAPAINWVRYHAEKGRYDVSCEIDERSAVRKDPSKRKDYRLQIQGPNAMRTMEKVLGAPPPKVKFFHMKTLRIAGKRVRALRHGMAGQPGFELIGPWRDKQLVVDALLEAGREFGLRRVGGRAYSTNTLDSGWIPSPLPAIYSGEGMREYREWLPADCYEASASIGGSFVSNRIEDYYFTPWDLSYGSFVKFDHEFIGRAALERIAKNPTRTKVTLALETEDVLRAIASQYEPGTRARFIEFPSAVYAMHPYDAVHSGGRNVGISTWIGYSSNARKMLSLAVLDNQYARPGTEVTLTWGEEGGGTSKPIIERHRQVEFRAVVSPVPYSEVARKSYADVPGWRAAQAKT
jgi:syringate O-demethylase